jgi:AcrR family transcriptional regulator
VFYTPPTCSNELDGFGVVSARITTHVCSLILTKFREITGSFLDENGIQFITDRRVIMARPHDPNTKIELLRAATAVFVECGLDRARVEDITARAGRSKGSFYLHFSSKEEAFRQIVESTLARLADCIEEAPLPSDQMRSVEETLGVWVNNDTQVFEFLWQNRRIMALLLAGGSSAHFRYLVDEFAERCQNNARQWIEWGIDQGIYRKDLDIEVCCYMISGAYDRLARQIVQREERPNIREWVSQLQCMFLQGIGSDHACKVIDSTVKYDVLGQAQASLTSKCNKLGAVHAERKQNLCHRFQNNQNYRNH